MYWHMLNESLTLCDLARPQTTKLSKNEYVAAINKMH
jgi:hypothetical protein